MPATGSASRGFFGLVVRSAFIPAFVTLIALGVSASPTATEGQTGAERLAFLPVATSTATPTRTATPTHTFTPSSTPTATATTTPTRTPAAALVAAPAGSPAATPTATPRLRPQPDGVERSARVPILMYHYISVPPNPADALRRDLSVAPEAFDAQMRWLVDNGYHTITLTDLYYFLAVGAPLPENPIILTFDDGYVDHYENAFPILRRHGLVGTFFILAGPADVSSPRYLTWDMIKEMSAAGQDIEVHGRDHIDMRRRPDDILFFQIVGTRQAIEAHTGKPAPFYAYPSGHYDARLLQFLQERDFWMAVTTQDGRVHTLNDALELTRVRIRGSDTLIRFSEKVSATR